MRLLKMAGFLALTLLVVTLISTFSSRQASARFGAAEPQDSPAGCDTEQHRQFDFWVGDWVVYNPDGTTAGSNTIAKVLGGCALHESWKSATGGAGNSYTFYDAARDRWHQTWIDARGGALYLDGEWTGSAMVLFDGTNRITWTPLDGGGVRQHWEVTPDEGATWSTAFDGEYIAARQE